MTAAARCIRKSCGRKCSKRGAALGVAFDGDADRAMFVSASGRHVDGDGVLLAVARYPEIHWPIARRPRDWHDDGQSGPGACSQS